jgi:ABC-type glycerol-3-phosphate transport system substrate-binding protein
MKKYLCGRCIVLCISAWISACVATPTPTALVPTPEVTASPAPTIAVSAPTPAESVTALNLWLPPQFAPQAEVPGGNTLAAQLTQFEAVYPDRSVRVRVKAARGPGGLIESLLTAYNVAPEALPDVVALDQEGLALASEAGVVVPLENLISAETFADYYPFAQALARVEDQVVGLPFAADARVLVYNTDVYTSAPARWAEVMTGTLIFPGAEPGSLTVLAEYLASGGALADQTGKPMLETAPLAVALNALRTVQQAGVLPLNTLAYTDTATTWQVFRERRASLALTSVQWYLAERSRVLASSAALPPTGEGTPFTLATGWSWAVVNKGADEAAALELLNWLSDSARMAEWTKAARVLPTRASALEGWGSTPFTPLAADVLTRARLQPPTRLLEVVGPALQKAADDVLNGRATSTEAATAAAQSLSQP